MVKVKRQVRLTNNLKMFQPSQPYRNLGGFKLSRKRRKKKKIKQGDLFEAPRPSQTLSKEKRLKSTGINSTEELAYLRILTLSEKRRPLFILPSNSESDWTLTDHIESVVLTTDSTPKTFPKQEGVEVFILTVPTKRWNTAEDKLELLLELYPALIKELFSAS